MERKLVLISCCYEEFITAKLRDREVIARLTTRHCSYDGGPPKFGNFLPFGKHINVIYLFEGLVFHLRNISTCCECLGSGSCQHHAPYIVISIESTSGMDQIFKEGVIERIHCFWSMELHNGDLSTSFLRRFHKNVIVGILQPRRQGSK